MSGQKTSLVGLGLVLTAAIVAGQTRPTPAAKRPSKTAPKAAPAPVPTPVIDAKAVEILKASCAKLAAADSLSFTALGAYEVPSLWGPPLIYGRIYEVALQRPNKLAVMTIGDGPRTEFYDDGKVLMSFHPAENLVALAGAPPTIDGALEKLYKESGTYFPFTDVVVADPWGDIAAGLTGAFDVGESMLVGGIKTDVVAYETNGVFIQMWIGKEDRLPYMARAMFVDDPLQLRQSVQFSKWQLNPTVAADAFSTGKAAGADKIAFGHPRMKSDQPPSPSKPVAPPKAKPKPSPTSH